MKKEFISEVLFEISDLAVEKAEKNMNLREERSRQMEEVEAFINHKPSYKSRINAHYAKRCAET